MVKAKKKSSKKKSTESTVSKKTSEVDDGKNILDGEIIKIGNELLVVKINKTSDKKNVKIEKETDFVEMVMSSKMKLKSQKKIKQGDIKAKDQVSVVCNPKAKSPVALVIKRIIVPD
jgi:hypothetical protein